MKKLITLMAMAALFAFACQQQGQPAAKPTTPAPAAPAATAPAPASAVPASFIIETVGGGAIQVSGQGGNWTANDGGVACSLAMAGNKYAYAENGAVVAEGKFEDGKLKMKTPDGGFYLKIKLKDGKIKIYASDDENADAWDLKFKEDAVKVKKGAAEYGKAKYYPDKGKIKIKDAANAEIGSVKGASGPFAAPAVLLIPDLDRARKDLALLALCALGK